MSQKFKELSYKMYGNPVIAKTFSDGKQYSLKSIKNHAKAIQKELIKRKFNGQISINALFPSKKGGPGKWRMLTQGFADITDKVDLEDSFFGDDYYGSTVDVEIPNKFEAFQVLIAKMNGKKGGNSDLNDCLYDCLKELFPSVVLKAFPEPDILKSFCSVNRRDKIPLSKLESIENKLKNCRIFVSGEYSYTSTKQAKHTIYLKLNNEHFTIDNNKSLNVKGISETEKPFLVYKYKPNDPEWVSCYKGDGVKEIKYQKLQMLRSKQKYSSPYMIVKCNKQDMNLKEFYEDLVKKADLLKEKTNGKYNLYKCGTDKKAALNRFYELNRTIHPEKITTIEAQWISQACFAPLIWAEKGYEGEAHSYDINSQYNTVMSDQKFSIPIKQGVFKKLTQEQFDKLAYFEYGIYTCVVSKPADNKLYRVNPKNFYTHYDLARLKSLGCTIKIIDNGSEPNLLSYAGADMRVNGDVAFKQYVDELYELKSTDIDNKDIYKCPMKMIWGALCEKVKWKRFTTVGDKKIYDLSDSNVEKILPVGGSIDPKSYIATGYKQEQLYDTDYARIAPFLLAKARVMISNIIEPHSDSIVRLQTDGFLCKKKIDFKKTNNKTINSVKIGTELGDLKYEGHCKNLKIIHVNKLEGEFIL